MEVLQIDSTNVESKAERAFDYRSVRAMFSNDYTICSATWPLQLKRDDFVERSVTATLSLRPVLVKAAWQVPIFSDYPRRDSLLDVVEQFRSGMTVKTPDGAVYYKLLSTGDDDLGSQALVSIEAAASYDGAAKAILFSAQMWVVEWNGENGRRPIADWSGGYVAVKSDPILLPVATSGGQVTEAVIKKHNFQTTFLVTNGDKVDPNTSQGKYKDGGFMDVTHDPDSIVASMTGVIDRAWGNVGHDCEATLKLSTPVMLHYQVDLTAQNQGR
jgi:hypothetical protein